jgi:maleate isomerase
MENNRIGIIIPSSNTTVEDEFSPALFKTGYSVHYDRIPLVGVTVDELAAMEKNTEYAAKLLKNAAVGVTAYACTTGSLFKGLGHDIELGNLISSISSSETVITSGAVVSALKELGAKNIYVITPYIDDLNKLEKQFLEDNGFNVVQMKGMNKVENLEIGQISSDELLRFVGEIDVKDIDAIFLSCTNMPTFSVIEILENKFNKPVVSSNSATLWSIAKTARIKNINGPGMLFKEVR